MMKKRKNVQLFAAAALTAALVTGQFSFATVMGDNTASVQVSSLIPDNVTIDQPVPLSDISLPKSDYGTLSWADSSSVPSARTQSYDVVFRPYNKADLAKISGWDGQSDVIYSSVTVVVSSISKDSDYEGSQEAQDDQEYTESEDTAQNTEENVKDDSTENTTGDTNTEESQEVTESPETADDTANSETAEDKEDTDNAEDATVSETPAAEPETPAADQEVPDTTDTSADTTEVTETPAAEQETPDTVEDTDVPATDNEIPEATVIPEADKDNIFDGSEKEITADDRVQFVETDAEPSDEEKAQMAESNHTCNGISVSGINLPWYVQFRVASGENYEFTNEAEANVFKSYEFELWDLKNNTEYEIPDGEYLSVTVPVKAGYDYTIEHLLDSGAMETIVPSVEGSTMVFSTHSFSPFGIAGSKALVGEEIEDGSYSSDTTSTTTTTPSATTASDSSSTTNTATVNNSSADTTEPTSVQSSSSGNQSNSSDSADQSEADNNSNSVGAVETGDNTPILPFVIIGIAAAVIVAALVYLKKKK